MGWCIPIHFLFIFTHKQINMNKLPTYKAVVNAEDESGMITISLVDEPAVEVDFLFYEKDIKPISYSIDNEEQRKVFGVVMTADTPIYRKDENGYEYYIVYDKKTIEFMVEKYLKQNRQNQVDTNHNFELEDGIYMNEIFIKDTEKGISPKGFEDVKDGSVFATFHIENDAVWSAIKEGTFKGFSLSGLFGVEKMEYKKQNDINMKLTKIKTILRSLLVEMGEITTDKGIIVWDGDELIEGIEVKILTEEGEEINAEDGIYTTEDKTIEVKDGKVISITDIVVEEPTEEPTEEPKEDELEEEQPTEEPTEEPTEDEKDVKIKELEAEIEAKNVEIEELKARIAELENEPADKSAEEAFSKIKNVEDNSPKGKMIKRGYKM